MSHSYHASPARQGLENDVSPESAKIEEARIRAAYAKREGTDHLYSWFSPGHVFMVHGRERQLLRLLRNHGFTSLTAKKIIEVGCGTGQWIREFIKWGARPENIVGVDLIPERVAQARYLCPETVKVECASATKIEFPDASFDLVLQSTVFTSVLDAKVRRQIASEMLRVLKPEGLVIWYDYHMANPKNRDTRGVTKGEIYQLFPGCRIELRRCTLAPPLVRWLARHSWLLAYLMERIPLLCTHYLGVIRKRS